MTDRDVSSVDASPQRGRSPGWVLGNREGLGVFAAPDVGDLVTAAIGGSGLRRCDDGLCPVD